MKKTIFILCFTSLFMLGCGHRSKDIEKYKCSEQVYCSPLKLSYCTKSNIFTDSCGTEYFQGPHHIDYYDNLSLQTITLDSIGNITNIKSKRCFWVENQIPVDFLKKRFSNKAPSTNVLDTLMKAIFNKNFEQNIRQVNKILEEENQKNTPSLKNDYEALYHIFKNKILKEWEEEDNAIKFFFIKNFMYSFYVRNKLGIVKIKIYKERLEPYNSNSKYTYYIDSEIIGFKRYFTSFSDVYTQSFDNVLN